MILNILYLSEDDETVFDFIGYSLESSLGDCSIKNFVADEEKDAIKILEFNNINLIVADMNIKSIYSFEFYDKLHADVKFEHIPFVFLSSNEEDQEISILKGLSNFFLKPLDVDQLLETLHNILSQKPSDNSYINNFSEDYNLEENSKDNLLLNEILDYTEQIENEIENNDIESIKILSQKIKDNTNKLLLETSYY